ncbi:protein of unknown function [Pseudomonas sp. JV241A]|nr:protein of unknown function [Pseudomonas sp. JV241A]
MRNPEYWLGSTRELAQPANTIRAEQSRVERKVGFIDFRILGNDRTGQGIDRLNNASSSWPGRQRSSAKRS